MWFTESIRGEALCVYSAFASCVSYASDVEQGGCWRVLHCRASIVPADREGLLVALSLIYGCFIVSLRGSLDDRAATCECCFVDLGNRPPLRVSAESYSHTRLRRGGVLRDTRTIGMCSEQLHRWALAQVSIQGRQSAVLPKIVTSYLGYLSCVAPGSAVRLPARLPIATYMVAEPGRLKR